MTTSTKKSTAKKTTVKKPSTKAAAKSGAAKPAAPKKTVAAKPKTLTPTKPVTPVTGTAPAAAIAQPAIVNAPEAVVVGPALRKREIIDQVVSRSGMKKRDVKPVIDHLLAVMGEGIAEGRELIVPPFGRVKVHKVKDVTKKKIYFAKVHQNTPPVLAPDSPKED